MSLSGLSLSYYQENEVRITELEPFIDMTVEVSAFTYWHVSAAATQMLTSPMAGKTNAMIG